MSMSRLLVATRSPGKLRELAPLLRSAGYTPVDLATAGIAEAPAEDAIEGHDTFEANALAKARHFFAISGLPTLADDSGLCVDALGGAPGVRSKRWSARPGLTGQALDDANNAKLLASLPAGGTRAARYVCAAAYVDDEGELVCRGETVGRIEEVPRGSGGFGYDPLFWSDDLGRTFGEATRAAKEAVSHRGRAVRAVLAALAGRR
ncbi:MAG: non-canonical purine NTP pyrophosphatase [Gemmatimonadota bacterium]